MRALAVTATTCIAVLLAAGGCARERERPPRSAEVASPRAGAAPAHAPTLEQLAGEVIMTKLVGPVASAQERAAIARLDVGGVILFGSNVEGPAQLRALTASLQAARRPAALRAGFAPRLLVSVDQEGGPIRNVAFAPPAQTQPQLADSSSADAELSALATGRALRTYGITMVLGPVADLVQEPNRTMAGRSFGSDPAVVAQFARASVRGLERGGVAAVVKHFPGFGAASANSDQAVAWVDRSANELARTELAPFRAAVAASVDAVMVSHGVHRELGSRLPGTLDPRVLRILREDLGFDGVAMTDSMHARGFRDAWGDTVPRACPQALAAGIDLLLLTGSLESARLCRARIIEAVQQGSLREDRLREAAARVAVLRARP